MNAKLLYGLFIIVVCGCIHEDAIAKKLHNRHYKFKITVPDMMAEIRDTSAAARGTVYYDTAAEVILMISTRESRFKSVGDYINCRNTELEKELQRGYEDTSLKIINCSRSPYYPEITTVLRFEVSVLPSGFNTYMIYFVHNKRKDIQFAFMYKRGNEAQCIKYIDGIMKTLRLRW